MVLAFGLRDSMLLSDGSETESAGHIITNGRTGGNLVQKFAQVGIASESPLDK